MQLLCICQAIAVKSISHPNDRNQRVKMNPQCLRHIAIGVVSLGFALFVNASEIEVLPPVANAFEKCQFTIRETEHLKLKAETSWEDADQESCSIHLKPTNDFAFSGTISLFVVSMNHYEAERSSGVVGFIQASCGKWMFQGTELLLSPKFLKKTFTQEQNGNETLLVGHQIVRGLSPNGGSIDIPGIRILRINPSFVTSLEANFNFLPSAKPSFIKGYMQLYDAFNKELVEIVKSVRVTPGVPGPTAKPAATP